MRRWLFAVIVGVLSVPSLHGQSGFDGTWQGETVSGRPVSIVLKATGSRLTGTFRLDKQTVAIAEGKVVNRTCSFRVSIDGRTPAVSGEVLRDQLTLSVEGVPNPVLLRRVK
jgi:hypothetical protein